MLKMQDKESGGFYPRVQSDNDENIKSRIIRDQNGCTTDDTACAAGILAHAYLIYKDIDPDFAQECLDAAINAWKFLEKNPENIVSPPGPYNVYDDSGDRLWAAASLYRATGEEVYHTYFKQNYKSFAQKFESPTAYAHTWGDMWLTALTGLIQSLESGTIHGRMQLFPETTSGESSYECSDGCYHRFTASWKIQ